MDINIILKTAISCMACDGQIDKEEINTLLAVSSLKDIDKATIISEVDSFNKEGKKYLKDFIDSLSLFKDDNESILSILRIAVDIIKADEIIDYKEICFFKLIINALSVSSDFVLDNISGIDEDWVEDDYILTKDEAFNKFFGSAIIPSIEINLDEDIEKQK